MEAAHTARQARLASLRNAKDSLSTQDTQSNPQRTTLHPFRRAFLLMPSLRPSHPTTASTSTDIASSTAESTLLRKFRNWDPMTGQARDGMWNTIQGIEDDVRGVQQNTLVEDELARGQELNLSALAPRKANWDLRRHLDKRLAKLRRRDKESRLVLIRQRLKAAKSASSVQAELAMSTAVGKKGLVPQLDGSDEEDDESD